MIASLNSGTLTIAELARLEEQLTRLGYRDGDADRELVAADFTALLTSLSQDERALVLDLTQDFLRCRWFDYYPLLKQAITQLDQTLLEKASSCVVLPLAETTKNGRAKSPSAILYPCAHDVLPSFRAVAGKQTVPYVSLELLTEKQPKRRNTLVIFVDDYIGSGGSAEKTIDSYQEHHAVDSDRCAVLALVGQRSGIRRLEARNIPVGCGIVRDRGISDCNRIADKGRALALMDAIEDRMGVRDGFRRGYAASEALVTMIRTPNNTFPLFWLPKTGDGTPWPAPFRRI